MVKKSAQTIICSKCFKCGNESRDLVICDQRGCRKYFCNNCRHYCYLEELTFCYDCHPELKGKK